MAGRRGHRGRGLGGDRQGITAGASVSPLLANVYLHYVLDLWADWWRRRFARGDAIIIRFADDFIVGFEHRQDAERFRDELGGRFARFGLALHPGKTRLVESGRRAARDRTARGEGKAETFTFLGFTHICATSSGLLNMRQRRVHDQLIRHRQQLGYRNDQHRQPRRRSPNSPALQRGPELAEVSADMNFLRNEGRPQASRRMMPPWRWTSN